MAEIIRNAAQACLGEERKPTVADLWQFVCLVIGCVAIASWFQLV